VDDRKSCGFAAAPLGTWSVKKSSAETVDKANLPRVAQDAKNEAMLRFMLLVGAMRVPAAAIMRKLALRSFSELVRYAIRPKMIEAQERLCASRFGKQNAD
jgi:hypothetical protein